jgi:hypothetical protein
VTGGELAAAALQRSAIAAIVNVARVICAVHIIFSLLREGQTRHNPPRVKYLEIIAGLAESRSPIMVVVCRPRWIEILLGFREG